MKYLKLGVMGEEVLSWQNFLRGLDLYVGICLGNFDELTKEATEKFQLKYVFPKTKNRRDIDGIVGSNTYAAAGLLGYALVKSTSEDKFGPNWPAKPEFVKHLSFKDREKLFGHIQYVHAPISGNPENIKITNDWQKKNLTSVVIPQLKKVTGAPASCKIFWNKAGVDNIVKLFKTWEDEKLLKHVKTWAGSWAPRLVRGGSTLSNHSHAVAFDINAAWNGLGREPAKVGQTGSVRELVLSAAECGFYWGGWAWGGTRKDGMHFELFK